VAHTVNLVPNDQRKSRISSDNKSCMVLAIDSRLESIALLNSKSFGFFDEARFITD